VIASSTYVSANVEGERSSGPHGDGPAVTNASSSLQQARLQSHLRTQLSPMSPSHAHQESLINRQLDMSVSTLSPASTLRNELYTSIIHAANPRPLDTSRLFVGRAITRRFNSHQQVVREALANVRVCHVRTDMWTSAASEAFGSYVVT